jgi:hypothetical protein
MAPNFQSSFIPKNPVTDKVFQKKKTGVVGILVVSLFIISIVASVGLFIYSNMVKSDIQNLESQVADAEKSVDKTTIDQMSQFSKKLTVAKTIVARHQVISSFLETLASSTVSSVQFTSFNYGSLTPGNLTVGLKGKASGYSSVALQENVFSKIKYFKSVTFSDLTLADKGQVSFSVNILVDPQITTYSP